ncbi:chemotaxis protein CheB [bacterium]
MNERVKTKVLLISREQSVFRFFSNLLSDESFDLLRCANPRESEKSMGSLKPAAVLLHVDNQEDMPLILLSRILMKHPAPTLLVSKWPDRIPDITSRGLKMGAVDLVEIPEKPGNISPQQEKRIIRTIHSCTSMKIPPVSYKEIVSVLHDRSYQTDGDEKQTIEYKKDTLFYSGIDIVGLAISTGGPSALSRFIPSLPEAFPPPVLVVQHIIPGFIKNVATRLNNTCAVKVKIAEDREPLSGGTIYFAPDAKHLRAIRRKNGLTARLDDEPSDILFRPSADMMFESLVECCGSRCMGVIMTGMGKDGVEGLRSIKQAGGVTMAQDRQSSAIYGMARIAVDENLIDHIVPLNRMAGEISRIILQSPKDGSDV